MKDDDLQINKGVELMLRRRAKDNPESKGLKVSKIFALRNTVFKFKFEFTWGSTT
tara:strand:- start:12371 stop:12535 length:165 start_codon:yes stop_codon:yes gene_type:complete